MPWAETSQSTRKVLPSALLAVALVLLVLRIGTGILEHVFPPTVPDFVEWHSPEGARKRDLKSGKPTLYFFTADWCGPCASLRREVFGQESSGRRISEAFYAVLVVDRQAEEGKNSEETSALQKRYSVESFPTLVAVPVDGGSPMMIRGYSGKFKSLEWLREAEGGLRRRPGARTDQEPSAASKAHG